MSLIYPYSRQKVPYSSICVDKSVDTRRDLECRAILSSIPDVSDISRPQKRLNTYMKTGFCPISFRLHRI